MKQKKILKLFMLLVGFKPKGFRTEQHDILFIVTTHIENNSQIRRLVREQLPVPRSVKVHIDAYVEVDQVEGHRIEIIFGEKPKEASDANLWFAFLGGYKAGEFKEYHKPLLIVAHKKSEMIKRALTDPFVAQMDTLHDKARPHLDDDMNVGADIDDYLNLTRTINKYLNGYRIVLIPNADGKDSILDPVITGYLKLAA